MAKTIWQQCLGQLESELANELFDTYIRPLHAEYDDGRLTLLAPNIYVEEKVRSSYLERISEYFDGALDNSEVNLSVGGVIEAQPLRVEAKSVISPVSRIAGHNLNREFTFDTFVEG